MSLGTALNACKHELKKKGWFGVEIENLQRWQDEHRSPSKVDCEEKLELLRNLLENETAKVKRLVDGIHQYNNSTELNKEISDLLSSSTADIQKKLEALERVAEKVVKLNELKQKIDGYLNLNKVKESLAEMLCSSCTSTDEKLKELQHVAEWLHSLEIEIPNLDHDGKKRIFEVLRSLGGGIEMKKVKLGEAVAVEKSKAEELLKLEEEVGSYVSSEVDSKQISKIVSPSSKGIDEKTKNLKEVKEVLRRLEDEFPHFSNSKEGKEMISEILCSSKGVAKKLSDLEGAIASEREERKKRLWRMEDVLCFL